MYEVTQNYRAVYKHVPLGFTAGDVVEVDESTAEWVNNDAPGTLVPVGEHAPAEEIPTGEPVIVQEPTPEDDEPVSEDPGSDGPKRRRRKATP